MKKRSPLAVALSTSLMMLCGCRTVHWVEIKTRDPAYLSATVVDQSGTPVTNLEVHLRAYEAQMSLVDWLFFLYSPPLTEDLKATTDTKGTVLVPFKHENLELLNLASSRYILASHYQWRRLPDERSQSGKKPFTERISTYDLRPDRLPAVTHYVMPRRHLNIAGTNECLDLATGSLTQIEEADLVLSVSRYSGDNMFATVLAPHGGIIKSEKSCPYAPQEGYCPGLSFFVEPWPLYGRLAVPLYVFNAKKHRYFRTIVTIYPNPKTRQYSISTLAGEKGSSFIYIDGHILDTSPPRARFYIIRQPDEFWRMYRECSGNVQTQRFLADQLYTPPLLMKELARSLDYAQNLMQNPNTPAWVLAEIEQTHKLPYVTNMIAQHKTQYDVFRKWWQESDHIGQVYGTMGWSKTAYEKPNRLPVN